MRRFNLFWCPFNMLGAVRFRIAVEFGMWVEIVVSVGRMEEVTIAGNNEMKQIIDMILIFSALLFSF